MCASGAVVSGDSTETLADSLKRKRIAVGISLALFAVAVINHVGRFGIFGRFSKHAVIFGSVLLFVSLWLFAPTKQEIKTFRQHRRSPRP